MTSLYELIMAYSIGFMLLNRILNACIMQTGQLHGSLEMTHNPSDA